MTANDYVLVKYNKGIFKMRKPEGLDEKAIQWNW